MKEHIPGGFFLPLLKMKMIVYILLVGMVSLGFNRYMESPDWMVFQTELSCDMDCCCQSDNGCEDHEGFKEKPKKEKPCHCACDCSLSIQIVAIGQHIPTTPELTPRAFDYGIGCDYYQSEYLSPQSQPPRIA